MKKICIYFILFFLYAFILPAQNQAAKWYFGNQAGLDFLTNPPTILTNGALNTGEGCSSISDANGNVLMYTDGLTVYNSLHLVMSNGTGLTGNGSTTQSGVIVKQPLSNNIYYIFTQDDVGGIDGLRYSTVDMLLSAGQGSVITKNVMLQTPSCEKLTSVRHCNGIDVWVISHDVGSSVFRNFLVTSSGVSTTPVTSTVGLSNGNGVGTLGAVKCSPNGKKIGVALYGIDAYEVFDFDASTGIVSNGVTLMTSSPNGAYGCEFSPDGTKFYAARYSGTQIFQWDMCAGTNSAIVASVYTIAVTGSGAVSSFQLGVNGKIYIARGGQQVLDVINTPNLAGSACGYTAGGQSISPKTNQLGLPNFITSWFKAAPPPFSYTISCQTASFTSPATPNTTMTGCSVLGYSLNSLQWDFGDPGSGNLNTSNIVNPSHSYAALGTYTVKLILNFSCGGGTDTIKQVVNINQPCISVSSTSITCANLGSATVQATGGIGPFSYTWMPTNQTSSVATGLSPGVYTIAVHDQAINFSYTATTVFTSLVPLTGNINSTNSVTCYAAANGTGAVTNIAGGSGNQTFAWTNGQVTYTNATVNTLSAGIWSITVTDALTGCKLSQSFYISQPNSTTVNIATSSPTACVNSSVTLTGTTVGGTAPYSYVWTGGPSTNTISVTKNSTSTVIYTLASTDANSCSSNNTISIDFIGNPTITVSNVSICPQKSGTLTANGATTYTWNNNTNGNTFVDNPSGQTQYTVHGTFAGCTSSTTASIYLYTSPVAGYASNSPICNGKSLTFNSSGGISYSWSGPNGFTSLIQSPTIVNATPAHSGVYQVTVASAQSCTASATGTVTVNPSPTIAATGATICNSQTVTLNGFSDPGNTYQWSGPASYQSTLQNAPILFPAPNNAGTYMVVATSAQGCTNSAFAILSVTMMPVPMITSDSPECEGGLVQLNGTGGGIYSWIGPNGFLSAVQNPQLLGISLAANGVYSLAVTLGPCSAATQHTVTVNALPQLTVSSSSPVCETKDLYLSAITSPTNVAYAWKGPGFTNSGATPVRPNSIVSYAGVYTLTVIDQNQCMSSSQTTVVINKNPVLSVSGSTVCLFEPAVVKASGANSYFWSGPNFYQASVAEPTIGSVNAAAVGVYTVTGTSHITCTSVATATVAIMPLPVPSLVVEPRHDLCLNEQVTFKGSGGKKLEWYGPLNVYKQGSVMMLDLTMPQLAGTYTLKATDEFGCSASISSTIAVKSLPDGILSGTENSACVPFCTDFSFKPNEHSGKVNSAWTLDGVSIEGGNFSYCFNEPGNFQIKGSLYDSVSTCENDVEYNISAFQKPIASFNYSPNKPNENDDAVYFTNTSQGDEQVKWQWLFRENNTNWLKEGENISHAFNEPGNFPVALLVENKWGCQDTVVNALLVQEDFVLYVPNAFTPTADDKNDIFKVVGRGVNKFHITVFDRWGAIIYESFDINQGWDGTVKGKPVKLDVYNWRIQATSIRGEQKELTGHVTLLR